MTPAERQKMKLQLQSDLQDTLEVCDRLLTAFGKPAHEGYIPATEEYDDLEEELAPLLDKVAAVLTKIDKEMDAWDKRSADREAKAVAEAIREREADRAYYQWQSGY